MNPVRRVIQQFFRHCSAPALAPRPLRVALSFVGLVTSLAGAQVAPDLHWRTITTAHFRVSFSDSLERTARRAAGSAERAYASLAKELATPRGTIDLVVADNLDISNGYATPLPSNRIVIYARPAVDANSLKFLDDWIDLVVTHELAHIFHLDRTRGLWRVGQWVFGRNPYLFPNTYSPSWLTEGIAVHYESKLTGAGRAVGTDFGAIIRAHENAGDTPGPHALSSSSPLYPLGNVAYAYGTQIVERAIARGGVSSLRDFIDISAGRTIPYLLNTNSKAAFGIAFDSTYAEWADSMHREAQLELRRRRAPPALVRDAWNAQKARWVDNSTIIWGGSDTKSVPSLREVTVAPAGESAARDARVIATRNTNDATTPLANGWRVYAQQEFTDAYTQRSDLWVERGGRARQITFGERLVQPDARVCKGGIVPPVTTGATGPLGSSDSPTFCVVAVQLRPGMARLVHVRIAGELFESAALTESSDEELWTEPRWSHDGRRIVATHWLRGGISEIAILDSNGKLLRTFGRARAVNSSPAWGVGDTTVFFTSDRSGRAALYRAILAGAADGSLTRIADSPTGLFESEPSPDGKRIATFVLGNNGMNLAVIEAPARAAVADSTSVLPPSRGTPLAVSDAPVGDYSAWRTVLPRYWLPELSQGFRDEWRYGLTTSGYDVIDRHSWALSASLDPKVNESEYNGTYRFSGLGNPVITIGTSGIWDHPGIPDSARKVLLPIGRRKQVADLSASFVRRRFRTFLSFTVGGSYEWRDFRTLADAPLSRFSPADRVVIGQRFTYPSFFVAAGFSNARQPALALGPENGFILATMVRQRWRSDVADATRATSVVGTIAGYRGFDFGGRIHHLLALRFATANEDATSGSEFTAGGGSGNIVQLAPGVTVGDGRRMFFVRGFEGGTLGGSRAMGMNAEWRAPLALPARGVWALPVYFQRLSTVLFADGATAWCPAARTGSPICPKATPMEWIGSAGAELHLDTALQYDAPYRFRLGYAVPTVGSKFAKRASGTVYVSAGLPF